MKRMVITAWKERDWLGPLALLLAYGALYAVTAPNVDAEFAAISLGVTAVFLLLVVRAVTRNR